MKIEDSPVSRAIECSMDFKEDFLRLVVDKLVEFGKREVEARMHKERVKAQKTQEENLKERDICAKVLRGNYDHLVIVRREDESENDYCQRMVRAMDEEWDRVVNWLTNNEICRRCGYKKQ